MYQEYDRRLKEQFINGVNNETIIARMINELTVLKDISGVSSEQIFMWVLEVEVQRVQKALLDNIRDAKECNLIRRDGQNKVMIGSKGMVKMRRN